MGFTIVALVATVLSLVCMGYFFLGSVPLLVLNHDTPLDSRFIRSFFNVYYRALPLFAALGTVSFALAGKWPFATGMAVILALTLVAKRIVLAEMDIVRASLTATDGAAIARFRRVHVAAIALNLAQLLGLGSILVMVRL